VLDYSFKLLKLKCCETLDFFCKNVTAGELFIIGLKENGPAYM